MVLYKWKCLWGYLGLLLLTLLLLFASALFAETDIGDTFIVKNLRVEDIPGDDGSGLEISWDALPSEAKIISYRIYRGTSPDSLFYIGEIVMNASDVSVRKSYTDKGFVPFVDISSPGRLRKEKVQPGSGNLFQAIPRDVSIVGPMLQHYTVLGIIPKNYFYYRTTKVENENGTFAGLKMNQVTLYKSLQADTEYFYTVVAMNSQRKLYPPAEAVGGTPINNAPETPGSINVVYLEDTNYLQFEWDWPKGSDDVAQFNIIAVGDEAPVHIIAKSPSTNYERLLVVEEQTTTARGETITTRSLTNTAGDTLYTFSCAVTDLQLYMMYVDNYGEQSGDGTLSQVTVAKTSDIPPIHDIKITDRKSDKGDYLELYWGRPFARVTNVSYLNEARTRLNIAYEYSTNADNNLKNIYFEFQNEAGDVLTTVNEYYFDNVFKVRVPSEYSKNKLVVKIYFNTKEYGRDASYYLLQELVYDEHIMTLRPQTLTIDGFNVNDFTFQLLRKSKSAREFSASKTFSYFDRETVDAINYISAVQKLVRNYDEHKGLLLVDSNIDLIFDTTTQAMVNTSIYKSVADKAEHSDNRSLNHINTYPTDKARMKQLAAIREKDRREYAYQMYLSNGEGLFEYKDITVDENGELYYLIPENNWFKWEMMAALIASLIFGSIVSFFVRMARLGKPLYIRPIAGIEEIDNAIGRATEMGRPILYCPGLSSISDVATLAGLSILGRVAKKAAEYDTKILVPNRDYIVLSIAQEIVREAHSEAGRPDSFDKNSVYFVSVNQFAYCAGVNGTMAREKTATIFYMGMFWAESLIMTEAGNQAGAIQIAGTDAVTQIPFFITTCDYTLIGEELYAASAYMNPQPLMLGTLKAQDYTKFLMLIFIIVGTLFSTFRSTIIIDLFPSK